MLVPCTGQIYLTAVAFKYRVGDSERPPWSYVLWQGKVLRTLRDKSEADVRPL